LLTMNSTKNKIRTEDSALGMELNLEGVFWSLLILIIIEV